ncbi:uncharacterized protein NEMAJ01_0684 [Nematocida major]|uniref:uncharacterized protein n=1 Tax=Nematocida major TaxID=1912982 RepID=UPI002007F363|nr:uncharacterized protein NEMAJ01_0684 [Nematocida major]KAH9385788.1 hypothetical protein NEMAJ01_0684 [Nematocida major]
MEECKELFQNVTQMPFSQALEILKEKLLAKQKRIAEATRDITEKEALEMMGLLEKKAICYNNCKKLYSRGNLSHDKLQNK